MGGLAALAREAGHKVTGCDAGVYPPMSDQLRALGIDLIEGFGADQMALKPDVYKRQYIFWEFAARSWVDWLRWRAKRATKSPVAMRASTRP